MYVSIINYVGWILRIWTGRCGRGRRWHAWRSGYSLHWKKNSNNSCFDHYLYRVNLEHVVYLYLCQELSYCCVVCHYLRHKIVWIMWFQLVILSIVALFTIVMWDMSSYMDLLMFYSLACLSFFRYRSHGFQSLSMYFSIDYYRFRNYRNIGAVFVSDNIVSISFSRKRCENESDLASYRSFPIVFIPKYKYKSNQNRREHEERIGNYINQAKPITRIVDRHRTPVRY
jgi:hypothetical protein